MAGVDRQVARRTTRRLELARQDHPPHPTCLVGVAEYKLRVEDYRSLAVPSQSEEMIIVERVDHRSRVHER